MEQFYNMKMKELGYDQLVCDIFGNWEDVKDELLISERKSGTGNGTIHVFLGAADTDLRKEFSSYYDAVKTETDANDGAINITHYFLYSNVISMLGHVCKYDFAKGLDYTSHISECLSYLSTVCATNGILSTTSLFKLSTGSNKLRPYFKQFESNGAFSKIIRKLLLPNSAYKISLYKNKNNEYAAFWLIGFDNISDFEADSSSSHITSPVLPSNNSSRQIIYYGAPGTGKSHKIKERLESENVPKENIFRTTFHPDSDYSTFVGAYKPTRGQKPLYGLNGSNTVRLHNNGEDLTEEVITYRFVQQAFLKAYIRAYEKPTENIFLIIEEINRGNCAQIFGDLFQLLDRDENGKSDYTIKADDDLKNLLEEEFNRLGIGNDGIADGELCLPGNLYIYATMNTSDQSLFPIDSAFKRRWDWEYEPIKYNHELQIKIEGETYKWTSFQSEVNKRIKDATSSEDKMLGDYFVNPSDGVIDEHTLRNKILFYLWNDVCKDGEGDIFKTSETEDISFSELYGEEGVNKLIRMMGYLKVETYNESEISKTFGEDEENASKDAKEWRRSFWSDVQVQYKNHGVDFKTNPTDRLYYQMGVGVVYMNFINAVNKQNGNCWVGVYFEAKRADELYRKMLAHKKEIDEKAPFDLEWIPNSAEHGYASIRVTKEWGNLDNPSNRTAAIKWFAERGASILKAIEPFIEELK